MTPLRALPPGLTLTSAETMAILRCGPKVLATLRDLHPELVAYTNGKRGTGRRYWYQKSAVLQQAGHKAG